MSLEFNQRKSILNYSYTEFVLMIWPKVLIKSGNPDYSRYKHKYSVRIRPKIVNL